MSFSPLGHTASVDNLYQFFGNAKPIGLTRTVVLLATVPARSPAPSERH